MKVVVQMSHRNPCGVGRAHHREKMECFSCPEFFVRHCSNAWHEAKKMWSRAILDGDKTFDRHQAFCDLVGISITVESKSDTLMGSAGWQKEENTRTYNPAGPVEIGIPPVLKCRMDGSWEVVREAYSVMSNELSRTQLR